MEGGFVDEQPGPAVRPAAQAKFPASVSQLGNEPVITFTGTQVSISASNA